MLLLGVVLAAATLGDAIEVVDAEGRKVRVHDTSRIVTLGGSITETVHALGHLKSVVGVDKSSLFPSRVKGLAQVGYFRAFSAEGVLSLRPSVVLASQGAGPKASVSLLGTAEVPVVMVSSERSVAGAKARVRQIAKVLKVDGEPLCAKIDQEIEVARAKVKQAKTKPRVLFVYARGAGTMNVAGRETGADEIIRLAGGTNAIDGFTGYKPLTSEAAVQAAPDVLLVTTHGLRALGGVEGLMKIPGVAITPAGSARRVVVMDDLLLLGFGPRVAAAVTGLSKELHPELFR